MDLRPLDRGSSEEGQEGLVTVTAAAQRAGVSRATVSGWITGGQLPAVRIDGRRS